MSKPDPLIKCPACGGHTEECDLCDGAGEVCESKLVEANQAAEEQASAEALLGGY